MALGVVRAKRHIRRGNSIRGEEVRGYKKGRMDMEEKMRRYPGEDHIRKRVQQFSTREQANFDKNRGRTSRVIGAKAILRESEGQQ